MTKTYRASAARANGCSGRLQSLRLFPAIALAALLSAPAAAHQAPKGWQYDSSCCSGMDCYQAPMADVKETKYGYQLSTGELIPYSDSRIKRSRDEFFHECKPGGDSNSQHSFCLYVPDHDM
ncbi:MULTISPECIES: hypothetical protein [unclassified Mesorhizobium]|uniref:hypothetical protein n=1 Tax=unclassified Mesorhizobium TaxID=325217 RepID=UPI000FCBEC57|nr:MULTISPECIES: hypothetical protein [unclassified Mesorhizobium]TIT78804.1 MAG: hypothetical protein E5W57_09660 [Mesorhizobium sp.]TGP24857.1 hypothetical protein EN874_006915 [Mesorhizobium sp. M1D.F.Ca.ET.231.01.1.1]TGP36180.1 hypothetical protein EN877_06915 [Mesorhizobium sp. M1D.F.Ca.ET.234.01.1.1]TGS49682.1 hypothetical protein EN827_06915 [Mesorhizobium sp. M1D.F.Ca.ET.184.01.1.1]TGS64394.1 hypothetical protein EN826_006915 [Mesorhizobium sp. M1D.F.Ca.ET.183.01.1.1]